MFACRGSARHLHNGWVMSLRSDASPASGAPYRPRDPFDLAALTQALSDLPMSTEPGERQRAGSDYHWYSPRLTQSLQGRWPDLVVRPRSSDEVRRVAGACARHRVPSTWAWAAEGSITWAGRLEWQCTAAPR